MNLEVTCTRGHLHPLGHLRLLSVWVEDFQPPARLTAGPTHEPSLVPWPLVSLGQSPLLSPFHLFSQPCLPLPGPTKTVAL